MKFYNTKEIKSKNITEYIFNIDALTAFDFKRRPGRKRRDFEELSSIEKAESMQRRKAYYQDKRFEIKRIIDCNYDDKSTFLTLTFKENIQDIERANREFTLFIKRLKRYLKNQQLKYIATWELQQRGAIHYHLVLFSVPYIDNKKLGELWANGFIKINKIKETVKNEAVGVYITKYFVKDLEKKANQKKAYFCSRNLIKPKETKKKLDFNEMNDIITNEKDLLYIKNFTARELLEIDAVTGEKIYREVKKVYVVQKNRELNLQIQKNVLNLEERQKELSSITLNSKNIKKI